MQKGIKQGDHIMGMSASQARLLSLTARMHDIEFQAQGLQYSKLDLVDLKNDVYEEYMDVLDSTKYQMSVVTPTGKEFQDVTYKNMIMSNLNAVHSMYTITNSSTGQIVLPEQIASKLGPDPRNVDQIRSSISPVKSDGTEKTVDEKLNEYLLAVAKRRLYPSGKDKNGNALTTDDSYIAAMKSDGNYTYWRAQYFQEFPDKEDFLKVVAKNYLYSGRIDLDSDEDYINEMKRDGNYNYWNGIYYQIIGYDDENGNPIAGRGFCAISQEKAVDRDWLADSLNSGEYQLFKMSNEVISFTDANKNNQKVNIFAETSMAVDTELTEVANEELIAKATVKYEKAIEDIDVKDTKFDMQLAKIDAEHNALKTEYDSVKQIVSKNIDRSFKTFNA